MALRMPTPFKHKTGVFFLNVRVPVDLVPKVRSSHVLLPVGDEVVAIGVTDKIFLSLKTKDPTIARQRFVAAYAALVQHWDAVRAGPKALTHRQLFALAGDVYRYRVDAIENDPDHGPHLHHQSLREEVDALAEWRHGDQDGLGEMTDGHEHFFAALQRPYGPQLIALEMGRDLDTPYAKVTYAEALEDLFGNDADRVCACRGLLIDKSTRARLLVEIGVAVNLVGKRVIANADRDYSVDDTARFPVFVAPVIDPPTSAKPVGHASIQSLIDAWTLYCANKTAPSTVRRYTPSLNSLSRFLPGKDVRQVIADDILRWAEHRRDTDGVSTGTINRNDLVAAAALFRFAMKAQPNSRQQLRADNPVVGVKLDKLRLTQTRDKIFYAREISAILLLARGVNDARYPRASASRRWAPWICAYSGARIQEVCWLRKEDVWKEGEIYVMRFPRTKEGMARCVPLHDALIDEGFLIFWAEAPDGPLFTGDRPQKTGASRSPAEQRASEIAAWIGDKIALEDGVSPNHGWRHTFITRAEGAGISKRMANALAGHNRKKDASDGYYAPPIDMMKRDLDKYPRYNI